jgi:hypothetical protein
MMKGGSIKASLERGASAVEYALCCAMVGVLSLSAVSSITDPTAASLYLISDELNLGADTCPNCSMGRGGGRDPRLGGDNAFSGGGGAEAGRDGNQGGGSDTTSYYGVDPSTSPDVSEDDGDEDKDGDGNLRDIDEFVDEAFVPAPR